MAAKTLGVGLIGCGFMGRTHSNAYLRLNNFFTVEHRPVLLGDAIPKQVARHLADIHRCYLAIILFHLITLH